MPSARFPYLFQAVRAGLQIVPDAAPPGRFLGVSPASGRLGCDALAAAWVAEFFDRERTAEHDATLGQFLAADLAGLYPVLAFDMGPELPGWSDDLLPSFEVDPPITRAEDHPPAGLPRLHPRAGGRLARVAQPLSKRQDWSRESRLQPMHALGASKNLQPLIFLLLAAPAIWRSSSLRRRRGNRRMC